MKSTRVITIQGNTLKELSDLFNSNVMALEKLGWQVLKADFIRNQGKFYYNVIIEKTYLKGNNSSSKEKTLNSKEEPKQDLNTSDTTKTTKFNVNMDTVNKSRELVTQLLRLGLLV